MRVGPAKRRRPSANTAQIPHSAPFPAAASISATDHPGSGSPGAAGIFYLPDRWADDDDDHCGPSSAPSGMNGSQGGAPGSLEHRPRRGTPARHPHTSFSQCSAISRSRSRGVMGEISTPAASSSRIKPPTGQLRTPVPGQADKFRQMPSRSDEALDRPDLGKKISAGPTAAGSSSSFKRSSGKKSRHPVDLHPPDGQAHFRPHPRRSAYWGGTARPTGKSEQPTFAGGRTTRTWHPTVPCKFQNRT